MQNCCTTSNAFGFPNHSLEAEQKPRTTVVGFVAGETVEKTENSRMVASFTSQAGGKCQFFFTRQQRYTKGES